MPEVAGDGRFMLSQPSGTTVSRVHLVRSVTGAAKGNSAIRLSLARSSDANKL
jgi:hypothetical protein